MILSRDIDTVFCQLIRAAQYALPLTNVWKVVDFVDAFSLNLKRNYENAYIFEKPYLYIRMFKTKMYERWILNGFDQKIIISENDKKAMRDESILVIPNGVEQVKSLHQPETSEKSIIFSGNMDYWPNQDAVQFLIEDIMPMIDEDIKIYIVGVNNNPKVYKYASDRVTITGKVDSIFEWIQKSTVAVCPMRLGAGLQNKVLEAMAANTSVIATGTANSGVGVQDYVTLQDCPKAFADSINLLVNDKELRDHMKEKALNFVKEHFDWGVIVSQMERKLWTETLVNYPQAVKVIPKSYKLNIPRIQ